MDKNPPANAGGHEFDPWSGKTPTCCEATKSVRHNCWARALESAWRNYWAHALQLLKHVRTSATREAAAVRSLRITRKSSPCSPQLERAHATRQGPSAAKNEYIIKFFKTQFEKGVLHLNGCDSSGNLLHFLHLEPWPNCHKAFIYTTPRF